MLGSNMWCLTSTLKPLGQRTSAIMRGLLNRVLQQLCKKSTEKSTTFYLSVVMCIHVNFWLQFFFFFTIDKGLLSVRGDQFYLDLA